MLRKILFLVVSILLGLNVYACSNKGDGGEQQKIPDGDYINRANAFSQLPGWKFRCKIVAEAKTVRQFGGRVEFLKEMDKLFARASKYFCVSGLNDAGGNQIHFFVTDMVEFEGQSKVHMYDDSGASDASYDIRLVVNNNDTPDDVAGGWLPLPYLAIGHNYDGLIGDYATDALVHEFGHSRGPLDLYATEVPEAKNNPINGQIYKSHKAIMNYPYGERNWSEYSRLVINASADKRVGMRHYDFFPKSFKVTVTQADGTLAKGAALKFYPVYPYSYKVTPTPAYEGATNLMGSYTFGQNPFVVKGQSDINNNIYNFLVEVEYNGAKTYTWMPIDAAEVVGAKGEPYVLNVKLAQ